MGSEVSSQFDRLPDEIIEYIFILVKYSPVKRNLNRHAIDSSSGSLYYPHLEHEPCLRSTFKDLKSLSCVCRRFYDILHSQTFWLRKCQQDHVVIFNKQLALEHEIDFRRLYFSNPFHPDYNILASENATNANKKHLWKPKIEVETIPAGSDILYDAFKQISPCFVTSYRWSACELTNINLIQKGQEKVSSVDKYTI